MHYAPGVINCNGGNGNQFCKLAGTDDAYYGYLIDFPEKELFIPAVRGEIESVRLLGTDTELGFRQERGGIHLTGFPDQPADPLCSVLKLKLSRKGIGYV